MSFFVEYPVAHSRFNSVYDINIMCFFSFIFFVKFKTIRVVYAARKKVIFQNFFFLLRVVNFLVFEFASIDRVKSKRGELA